MVANDTSILSQINRVERVQTILAADIHGVVAVAQNVNHAGRHFACFVGMHERINSRGRILDFLMGFAILQQVHTKIVQAQIHDVHATLHVFKVHHVFFQLAQLFLAVFQVALLFGADRVVVAGRGHHRNFHAGDHTRFQVDVFIKAHVGPKVHQLDFCILAADTIYTAKALDNAHRVPVDIVIDQVIAILQVLAFANAVRRNQQVDIARDNVPEQMTFLGLRRKIRQHRIVIGTQLREIRATVHIARYKCRVDSVFLEQLLGKLFVEVFRRIGKCREQDYLLVPRIDWVFNLVADSCKKGLQLGIVFRRKLLGNLLQLCKYAQFLAEFVQPANVIHIGQIEVYILANGKFVIF